MCLFSLAPLISPTVNWENTILMGCSTNGINAVMEKYILDAEKNGCAVLLFRDMHNAYSATTSGAHAVFSMNSSRYTPGNSLDLYAGLTEDDYACSMLETMDRYHHIDNMVRMEFEEYIALIIRLARLSMKRVKMNEFILYPIAEVRRLNDALVADPLEHDTNESLINSVNKNIGVLQAYFSKFGKRRSTVGDMLSGSDSLERVLDRNSVLEISLDFAGNEPESAILMDAFIDRFCRNFNFAHMTKKRLCILADQISAKHLQETGFDRMLNMGPGFPILYSVQDITNLTQTNTNWVNLCKTVLCLQQTASQNAKYCSDMFGTVIKWRMHINWFGRLGFTMVPTKEQKYEQQVFLQLSDHEAIYYNRDTRNSQKVRLY